VFEPLLLLPDCPSQLAHSQLERSSVQIARSATPFSDRMASMMCSLMVVSSNLLMLLAAATVSAASSMTTVSFAASQGAQGAAGLARPHQLQANRKLLQSGKQHAVCMHDVVAQRRGRKGIMRWCFWWSQAA
jgi:hypothetical protein